MMAAMQPPPGEDWAGTVKSQLLIGGEHVLIVVLDRWRWEGDSGGKPTLPKVGERYALISEDGAGWYPSDR
jgi:hypothetical protein